MAAIQTVKVIIEDEWKGRATQKAKRDIRSLTKVTEQQGKASKTIKKQTTLFDKQGDAIQRVTRTVKRNLNSQAEALKKADGAMRELRKNMLGVGLSFLFFGIAVRKFALDIIRGAVAAFNKILESSGLASSALQELAVMWEFLKFTVGEAINAAINPYREAVLGATLATGEWINNNQRLVASIAAIVFILGTLMFLFGTFILFGLGLTFVPKIIALIAPALLKLLPIFGLIGIAIVLFIALWTTNFANFRNRVKSIWRAIGKSILGVFKSLRITLGGIWDVITGFLEGDTEKMALGMVKIITGLVLTVANLFAGLGVIMENVFGFAAESVVRILTSLMVFVVSIFTGIMRNFARFFDLIGQKGIAGKIRDVADAITGSARGIKGRVDAFVSGQVEARVGRAEALQAGIFNLTVQIGDISTTNPEQFASEVGRLILEEIKRNQ